MLEEIESEGVRTSLKSQLDTMRYRLDTVKQGSDPTCTDIKGEL